jgi:hypothetical protein
MRQWQMEQYFIIWMARDAATFPFKLVDAVGIPLLEDNLHGVQYTAG